jgi:hypothetical protein
MSGSAFDSVVHLASDLSAATPSALFLGDSSALGLLQTARAESLRLLEAPEVWSVLLLFLPACVLLAWLSYRRQRLTTARKWWLGALRGAALLLLFVVLWRPVQESAREEIHPAVLAVLVDDWASMLRQEDWSGAGSERASERREIERVTGLQVARATRLELARAAVERVLLPRAAERKYEVELYAFDAELRSLARLDALSGQGGETHVEAAVARACERLRGRHVTDLVLVSDGRDSPNAPSGGGANAARLIGARVHTVLVGDPTEISNAVLELAEIPDAALAGDELALAVRVRATGLGAARDATVTLEELDAVETPGLAPDDEPPGRVVDARDCRLSTDGERVVLIAPPGDPASNAPERRFRASLSALDGETLLEDNSVVIRVPVSVQKIRVLYVEGYPRWEYRYLALHLLERTDARVEFQAWLASAEPDFRQESSKDLPPLQRVPITREELLSKYDVVIIGDVRPDEVDRDPLVSSAFWEGLVGFVEAGGGVLFEAGESANPRSYLGTPAEALLPVLVDPVESAGGIGGGDEFRLQLENPQAPHEIMRLHADLDINRKLLELDLRGFYWYFPVLDKRPGAQVLARHSTQGNERGLTPLLVAAHHPKGRVLYLGIDSTWRWRYEFGDRYHVSFWRNALRWLALERTRGAQGRVRLEAPRSAWDLGERVAVEARLLDEDWKPRTDPAQALRVTDPQGRSLDIELALDPATPGLYRGTFDPDRPGVWRASIESAAEVLASLEVQVRLPMLENRDPTPDPAALARLSGATGGKAVALGSIDTLFDELPGGEEWHEPVSAELRDVWDGPYTLLALLLLLSVEWLLRKRWELP